MLLQDLHGLLNRVNIEITTFNAINTSCKGMQATTPICSCLNLFKELFFGQLSCKCCDSGPNTLYVLIILVYAEQMFPLGIWMQMRRGLWRSRIRWSEGCRCIILVRERRTGRVNPRGDVIHIVERHLLKVEVM